MLSQPLTERAIPPPSHDADDPFSRDDHWVGSHPLADEHAVLLGEVRVRERAVRTALGTGRWPDREIDALVAYLRYEVLDQAAHEELLLFPRTPDGFADSRVQELVAEHVHLRDVTGRLTTVRHAQEESPDPQALIELLDDLEEILERHMRSEETVLATATTDGVESLRQPFRCHLWFPLTEGSELDLDVLPREFAHRAALERFSRMRPGQQLLVRSSCELESLWNLLACGQPGEFGWAYLEEGPVQWRVEVTRRGHECHRPGRRRTRSVIVGLSTRP
jgi:uncharacterized protein (DUF2249 family)/hemerythrin-like domain-containing protein